MTKPDTVGAYTYRAEIYCPDCIIKIYDYAFTHRAPGFSVEETLDALAQIAGIDRYAEETFDSDTFPKVVFIDQLTDGEHCGSGHPIEEAL